MATQKLALRHVEGALRQTAGIVSAAAKILEAEYGSCTPATVRNYLKRHPSLQKVADETVELNLDLAESKLLKNIGDGKEASIFFYLKTKGKARGYVERVEATGKDGGPIKFQITAEDLNAARQRNIELIDGVARRLAGGAAGPDGAGGADTDPQPADPAGGC